MITKKIFRTMLPVVFVIFAGLANVPPACAALLGSYVDPDFDFAQMKRIYVWPAECENCDTISENVRFSLPGLIEEWTGEVLADRKRAKLKTYVKSTEQMWKDIQFIKGPLDFDEPFESAHAAAKFHSLLGEACEGVLEISVSVRQDHRWQEPTIEYDWEWDKVTVKNRKGELEEVDMLVTKERTIPGRWLVDTRAECRAELYDAGRPGDKSVAAAWSEKLDTRDKDKSERAAKVSAENVLRSALGGIFYKKEAE